MDITHYSGNGFLLLTDCEPIHFTVWCKLACQDASAIVQELRLIFFEQGAPAEILMDNTPAFYSQTFLAFTDEWGIQIQYWCAYVPPHCQENSDEVALLNSGGHVLE